MEIIHDPPHSSVLELITRGKNLFITGPGGVGKSTLVRRIAEEIPNVGITAMTGCAALLLDCKASTLHSWTGIGLGLDTLERTIDSIKKKQYVKRRWTKTNVLVIDEISMMSPELFEFLDTVGQRLRKNPKPFGGLQLVLVGDFCQLPPVTKDISGGELQYVFESPLWTTVLQTVVVLNKIWRQTDPVYQKVLNEARMGALSAESEAILLSRMNTRWQDEVIKPTLLFSLNKDVDKINVANLNALDGEVQTFKAKTVTDVDRWRAVNGGQPLPDSRGDFVQFAITKLDRDAPYVESVELRVGAQVMLISNLDMTMGLVNGSRGIITAFEDIRGYPIVKFRNGIRRTIEPVTWWSFEVPHIGRDQMPLKIAYAITIHKSQGASIDAALVDIGKSTFEYGQAYTALSRVRSLEGLHLHAFDVRRIKTHPRVRKFYRDLLSATELVYQESTVKTPVPESTIQTNAWSLDVVHSSWLPILKEALTPKLEAFVSNARSTSTVFPSAENVFTALQLPLDDVKVVILGQDPYHGAGQAMGFSFSVPDGVTAPPSLKNIMKEVLASTGKPCAANLTSWFQQGVLLLNSVLTVEESKPNSHAGQGWEVVTDALLRALCTKKKGIVFMLWGKYAQKKELLLGSDQHVLKSAHPSPLSAHTGFHGCRHFVLANEFLGSRAICWGKEK
jgi:ATP-dependent DNA helicase PIF1